MSNGKTLTVVASVVAGLVLIAGLAYRLMNKNAEPTAPEPTPLVQETTAPAQATTGSPTASAKSSATPKPTATPTPAPLTLSMTLSSNGDLDGFRSSNNGGNATLDIRAGRNSTLITRGFVSFDIPTTLNGKTIEKATLRLYQALPTGSPYTAGSSVKVDHLDYGSSLENADYSASSLSSSFATLTSNAVVEWKDVDVTDRLKDDMTNSRPRSQYRIHLAIEAIGGDVTGDFAYFESENNSMGTGNKPQLVVKYH